MCVGVYLYTYLRSSCVWYVYICVCIYAHLCLYVQRLDKMSSVFLYCSLPYSCETGSLNEPEVHCFS